MTFFSNCAIIDKKIGENMKKTIKILTILVLTITLLCLFRFNNVEAKNDVYKKYNYNTLDTYEKTLYDALHSLNKNGYFINGGSIDLLKEKKVDEVDLEGLRTGTSNLYLKLEEAKEAYMLDHAELFYVDFNKITLRAYQDESDQYHIDLSTGLFQNALKEDYLDGLDEAIKAFNSDIDALYKAYKKDNDMNLLIDYDHENAENIVKKVLDKLFIDNYLMDFGYGLENIIVIDGEKIALNELPLSELMNKARSEVYSHGVYDFNQVDTSKVTLVESVTDLPYNFKLCVKYLNGEYQLSASTNNFKEEETLEDEFKVMFPYPNHLVLKENEEFVAVVNGIEQEAYNLKCGLVIKCHDGDNVKFIVKEKVNNNKKLIILSGANLILSKDEFEVKEDQNISMNISASTGYYVDDIKLNGITIDNTSSKKSQKILALNYSMLDGDSVISCSGILKANKEKEAKTLSIQAPVISARIVDLYQENKEQNHSFYKEGENVYLFVDVSQEGNCQYAWYKDGVLLKDETSPLLIIDKMTKEDAGKYQCLIHYENNLYGEVVESECFNLTYTYVDTSIGIGYIIILGLILLAFFLVGNIYDNNNQKFREMKKKAK